MATVRTHLASGTVTTSATETTIYQPTGTKIGTCGSLTFFNSSTTATILVTVYGPHAGAAANEDLIDEFYLGPRDSYLCRNAINKVASGASSQLFSVECDTGGDVLTFSMDGTEG